MEKLVKLFEPGKIGRASDSVKQLERRDMV